MEVTLARRVSVSSTSRLFTFEAGPAFPTPKPGQFVSVQAEPHLTLPRPFSIAGIPAPGRFDLLVEVRGPGTRALDERPVGSKMRVLGPLGNSFSLPEERGTALLVAGGIGVAGLRLAAQELGRGYHSVHALVGARTSEGLLHHLLPPPTADGEILIETATDDGSEGFHGTVVELMRSVLDEGGAPDATYCCGPRGMLDAAAALASDRGLRCQLLLEEVMACGVGACRGCVVETRSGYRTVCSDGPVFEAEELVLMEKTRA